MISMTARCPDPVDAKQAQILTFIPPCLVCACADMLCLVYLTWRCSNSIPTLFSYLKWKWMDGFKKMSLAQISLCGLENRNREEESNFIWDHLLRKTMNNYCGLRMPFSDNRLWGHLGQAKFCCDHRPVESGSHVMWCFTHIVSFVVVFVCLFSALYILKREIFVSFAAAPF